MIVHTPGEMCVIAHVDGFNVVPAGRPRIIEADGNVALLRVAHTAPHECSDPQCPGNVNRRKLAAFDGLLAACEASARYFAACGTAWQANDGILVADNGRPVVKAEGLDELCDVACDSVFAALAKTEGGGA